MLLSPTLSDPMDYSPQGSSVPGNFSVKKNKIKLKKKKKRKMQWVAIPTPGSLSNPEVKHTSPTSPALAGIFFTLHHLGSP